MTDIRSDKEQQLQKNNATLGLAAGIVIDNIVIGMAVGAVAGLIIAWFRQK